MANTPVVNWRFVLLGEGQNRVDQGFHVWVPISILDGIAADISLSYVLNRCASCTFSVPSEDPRVNTMYWDSEPYLSVGKRAVWAFRKVGDSPGGWELKFAGRVWNLEDQGDGDTVRTMVTCYDPMKILEKRVVRDAEYNIAGGGPKNGRYWGNDPIQWWLTDASGNPLDDDNEHSGTAGGAKIIKDMIERSRRWGGLPPGGDFTGAGLQDAPLHIETGTYGWPGNGTFEATAPMPYSADPGSYIMPAIVNICNTGTVDLIPTYLTAYNGVFLRLAAVPRRGTDKSGTVTLAYAVDPFTASQYGRVKSMDQMANFIHFYGGKATGQKGVAEDADSKDFYLVHEAVENLSDVKKVEFLQMLADMRLEFQKLPKDIVSVTPTPEGSPSPWDDYDIGDTISVEAASGDYPVTREVLEGGVARVYGFTINIDNDFGEYVSDLLLNPSDAA